MAASSCKVKFFFLWEKCNKRTYILQFLLICICCYEYHIMLPLIKIVITMNLTAKNILKIHQSLKLSSLKLSQILKIS